MGSEIFFDNKKYISAKEAGRLTKYSQDYIGQLCRQRKVDSRRVGRIWYISEESMLNYKSFFEQETFPPKNSSEIASDCKINTGHLMEGNNFSPSYP